MGKEKISVFWFRRDLRLEDNLGLIEALKSPFPVLPVFIFDREITDELEVDDSRVSFIYDQLKKLSIQLGDLSSAMYCKKGKPKTVWSLLVDKYDIHGVYANEDYEPYAILRDQEIKQHLQVKGVELKLFKDQVIFAKDDVLKGDKTPYTVFTPYKNKWMEKLNVDSLKIRSEMSSTNFFKLNFPFPTMTDLGLSLIHI